MGMDVGDDAERAAATVDGGMTVDDNDAVNDIGTLSRVSIQPSPPS